MALMMYAVFSTSIPIIKNQVDVQKSSGRNVWLYLTLKTGKNREIRRVMQKLDLRVNRLFRDRYGPYWLKGVMIITMTLMLSFKLLRCEPEISERWKYTQSFKDS